MMKLNLEIIFDHLKTKFSVQRYNTGQRKLYLGRPMFYEIGCEMQPETLYITRTDILPQKLPLCHANLICVGGQVPSDYLSGKINLLLVTDASASSVFNEVQAIYNKFDAWDSAMQQILHSDEFKINELVKLGIELFDNVFSFVNPSLEKVVSSKVSLPNNTVEINETIELMTMEEIQSMKEVCTLERLIKTPFLSDYKIENVTIRYYCYNLYYNDYFIGCVSVQESHRPFLDSEFPLIDYFFSCFEKAYIRSLNAKHKDSIKSTSIKNLLHHIPLGNSEHQLLTLQDDEEWVCFYIMQTGYGKPLLIDYMCEMINAVLKNIAYASLQGDVILGLLRIKTNACALIENPVVEQFQQLLGSMGYYGGIGNSFKNLQHFDYSLRQAKYAAKIHQKKQIRIPIAFFEDYYLDYILQNSIETMPIEFLNPTALARLQKYDSEKGTELVKTLEYYLLHETNGSKTSDALYIHRSSLQKRLDKIQEIMKENFEDPDTKLYYRLLFRLYRKSEEME